MLYTAATFCTDFRSVRASFGGGPPHSWLAYTAAARFFLSSLKTGRARVPWLSSVLDFPRSWIVLDRVACAHYFATYSQSTRRLAHPTPLPPHPTPQNGASDGSARAFMISAGLTPPSAFALLSPARQKPVRCLYHAVRRLCQPLKGVQCNQCISASRDFAEQRWSLVGAWQRPFVPQNSTILWSLASTFDSTLAVFVKVRHY